MDSNKKITQKILKTGPSVLTEPRTEEQEACVHENACNWKSVVVTLLTDATVGDRFWDNVEDGSQAAARDLGCYTVMPRLSEFNLEKQYVEIMDFIKKIDL